MALPKLDSPVYDIEIPSMKKKVKYRPFLVKEEKLLLMARESKNTKEQITCIKQIINNCILDEIDVDTMTTFDLEFLFVNLRARSVGEVVEVLYECPHCREKTNTEINLTNIAMENLDNTEENIKLTNSVGMKMKYPTFDTMLDAENSSLVDIVVSCLEYIYDEKTTYSVSDYTRDEVGEFLESLTFDQLKGVEEFFDKMPKLVYRKTFKCPVCGESSEQVIEGITNFF